MKMLCYSTKDFERPQLETANAGRHELHFTPRALSPDTVPLAEGFEAVCIFAGDDASAPVLKALYDGGISYVAIRAAGYDNVDLEAARTLGIRVANVPAYSPYAVAEHAVALVLALNRKLILADRQVHRNDFRVDNLVGTDLHGKTVGIIGTGKIGSVAAAIFHGFGCTLLGYDVHHDTTLIDRYSMEYTGLGELCSRSDVISIHTCLTPATRHLINQSNMEVMKRDVILVNTSRGAVVDTGSLLKALEEGSIGAYGMDVYEEEKGIFFYDHSANPPGDPLLRRLLQLPNVLVTPHQAFATREALRNIADTTMENLDRWAAGTESPNELHLSAMADIW